VLTPMTAMLARRVGWVDLPGGRKTHSEPVPLMGGVALLLSLCMGGVAYGLAFGWGHLLEVLGSEHHLGIVIPALMVFLVGAADDVRGVSPLMKVVVQAMGAAVAINSGLVLDSLWTPWGRLAFPVFVSYPLTMLWFIGVTNAFNLIDGLDGLLASVGAASMLGTAFVSIAVGQTGTAFLPLAVAGALVGFLPWNWQKARIFLGDSGSLLVGFLAAALSLKVGRYTHGVALHVMVALCFLPVFETLLSMARRYVGGKPLFSGDRSHIHHVLVHRKGLSVSGTVLVLALIQVLFSGIAVVSRIGLGWWSAAPAGGLLLLAAVLIRWVDYVEFRVLWHRVVGLFFGNGGLGLASSVDLARAGRAILDAHTPAELGRMLEELRAGLDLSSLEVAFTDAGVRAVGDDCVPQSSTGPARTRGPEDPPVASWWTFTDGAPAAPDPGESSFDQTVTYPIFAPDGTAYGRLVCSATCARETPGFDPAELRRYVVAALAERIRSFEEGRSRGHPGNVPERSTTTGGDG